MFTNIKVLVQVLKILLYELLKTLKLMLKNECKYLCYYFLNEIKNSTHSNENILRLKQ